MIESARDAAMAALLVEGWPPGEKRAEMAQPTAAATRGALQSMWEAGLTETQILSLLWLKRDVFAGRRSEIMPEHKRLLSAHHLYERGLLSDSYRELH